MEYSIRVICGDDQDRSFVISTDDYHILANAKSVLSSAILLEDNYQLVLSNFHEFEAEVLMAALENQTAFSWGIHDFQLLRSKFNRRAINFLAVCRLYIDQQKKILNSLRINEVDVISKSREIYDSEFGYRFMEALRNYALHEGCAVHEASISIINYSELGSKQIMIQSNLIKNRLEGSGFKKRVLDECPEKIDVLECARKYVDGISSLHSFVRAQVQDLAVEARKNIEETVRKAISDSDYKVIDLAVISCSSSVERIDFSISLLWDDIRLKMIERNHAMPSLNFKFVSNKSF